MNFVDATLLRLASPAERQAMLTQDILGGMLAAAFDTASAAIQGPYAIAVDRLDLGVEVGRSVTVDGTYVASPGTLPGDLRLKVGNLQVGRPLQVDTLWRGQLIARWTPQDDRVTSVSGGFTLLDIDRQIISDLGALPAGGALETERRTRLIARLKAGAAQPDVVDDQLLDALFAASGVADAAGLLKAQGTSDIARLKITFSPPAQAGAPVPLRLPVTVAVLIRDSVASLAQMFADSRAIRSALAADPAVQPADAAVRRLVPVLLLWVLPSTSFNDAGWPGGNPAARKANAIQLLSGQGIALATA